MLVQITRKYSVPHVDRVWNYVAIMVTLNAWFSNNKMSQDSNWTAQSTIISFCLFGKRNTNKYFCQFMLAYNTQFISTAIFLRCLVIEKMDVTHFIIHPYLFLVAKLNKGLFDTGCNVVIRKYFEKYHSGCWETNYHPVFTTSVEFTDITRRHII